MIRTWRITDARYGAQAFDGEGARLFGGRWNHKGTSVVYTCDSLALAALEQLVHVSAGHVLPPRVAISVDISDAVSRRELTAAELPQDWRNPAGSQDLKALGTLWAAQLESAVLIVPSVVIPQQRNYVLNPLHPDFALLEIGEVEPFAFDPRLLS
ncbi:MAG: RES domain-containing protein [Bradymonadaceae bacterium]|nr:RES domain-containing protein [Lujinxingiaceae bacterium]